MTRYADNDSPYASGTGVHRPADIAEARGWIADCEWADDISDLTDAQVVAGVDRHYDGGWFQFMRDSK